MSAPKDSSASNKGGGSRSGGTQFSRLKLVCLVLAVSIFVVATFTALTQNPHPNAYRRVDLTSLDGWLYPIERNAFRRLPVVEGQIKDLFHLKGTSKVWAVGEDGLILHSDDYGRIWKRTAVDWDKVNDWFSKQSAGGDSQTTTWLPTPSRDEGINRGSSKESERSSMARPTGTAARGLAGVSTALVASVLGQAGDPPPGEEGIAKQSAPESSVARPNRAGDDTRPRTGPLRTVFFLNDRDGWIGTSRGLLLRTDDGGDNWTTVGIVKGRGSLVNVRFSSKTRGYARSDGAKGFQESNDGGVTWQAVQATRGHPVIGIGTFDGRAWAVSLAEEKVSRPLLWMTNLLGEWEEAVVSLPVDYPRINDPFSFRVHNSKNWTILENNRLLWTTDGGANWVERTVSGLAKGERVMNFWYVDETHVWVLGDDGTLATTDNGGEISSEGQRRSGLLGLWPLDRSKAIGYTSRFAADLVTTFDEGRTWNRAFRPGEAKVCFAEEENGFLVSSHGGFFVTRDGGRSWTAITHPSPESPVSRLTCHGDEHAWVSTSKDSFSTSDGGQTWGLMSHHSQVLLGVHVPKLLFVNEREGFLAGRRVMSGGLMHAEIAATSNGGETWVVTAFDRAFLNPPTSLFAIMFAAQDANAIWMVGHLKNDGDSLVWRLSIADATWALQSIPGIGREDFILNIQFRDASTGWIVTDSKVFETTDGATSWHPKPFAANIPGDRGELRFLNPDLAYIPDAKSIVRFTRDAGATWTAPPYRSYPAPWYYVSWLAVIGLLVPVFKPQKPRKVKASVANAPSSDRPLEPGDHDPLGIGGLARGLAFFLRNKSTQAPLTMAVTGAWGSGKSSLMNLLRHELKRGGFRTVWFNAWHHQTEEHLLASLLERVRSTVSPSVLYPSGLWFRLKLILLRMTRRLVDRPIRTVVLVGVLSAAAYAVAAGDWTKVGASGKNPPDLTSTNGTSDGSTTDANKQGSGENLADDGKESGNKDEPSDVSIVAILQQSLPGFDVTGRFAGLLVLLIGGFGPIRRGLAVIGVDPASLILNATGNARSADVKARTSFRYRFSQQFEDVTWALGPRRRLVIFIDDLDRCAPGNVIEMLQAANYLMTAGRCIIIMGFDPVYIRSCISLEYKALIKQLKEMNHHDARKGSDVSASRDDSASGPEVYPPDDEPPSEFAVHYLQKLVNVEVPVPMPDTKGTKKLLVPPPAKSKRPLWERGLAILPAIARPVSAMGFWVALVYAAWHVGNAWLPHAITPDAAVNLASVAIGIPPSPDATPTTGAKSSSVTTESGSPDASKPSESRFMAGDADERSLGVPGWLFPVLLACLVLAGLAHLEVPLVRDSPLFEDALRGWQALITAVNQTPREIIRYRNRVRYYAMRQRGYRPPLPWWRRLFSKRPDSAEDGESATKGDIPEDILVALSALEEYQPDWLDAVKTTDEWVEFANNVDTKQPSEFVKYISNWKSRAKIQKHVARFREMSGTVTIR